LTLPYQTKLAVYLSVGTFSAAFILPYVPGRPYLWEFAALLGWSGLVITTFMRQYRPGLFQSLMRNRFLFLGIAGYSAVLLITMWKRGIGLNIFGSQVMGGRFYFQQVTCAVFPLLFLACCPLNEKTIIRLVIAQNLCSATF